jgi:hypothetical protein
MDEEEVVGVKGTGQLMLMPVVVVVVVVGVVASAMHWAPL